MYVGLTIVRENILFDSIAVLAPALGGAILSWVLVKSVIDLADPANSTSGSSWLGLGPPLVIGIAFMVLGALLMVWWSRAHPAFFGQKVEVFAAPHSAPTGAEPLRTAQ